MKFCLIYNKNSSRGNKLKYVKKIYKEIKKKYLIDLYETKTEQEVSEIIKIIEKNKYDRLILAGGDGTVLSAINELFKFNEELSKRLVIGYIPCGTTNILKYELKIPKTINQIVEMLTSNKIKKVNLFKINDKFFLLMASSGWDAEIVKSIRSPIKKSLGKIIFIIKCLQKLILMKSNKIKVLLNGKVIYTDWIICSNAKYYAGHYSISNTNIFEDKIVIFIVKDINRIKLLYFIYIILFYGDLSFAKGVISTSSKSISLEKLSTNIPIQIDGDYIGSFAKVNIEASDKKINLIYGKD